MIHDQGSFYIGGVPKTTHYANTDTASTNPNDIIIGQMYVQFQIPGGRRARQYKGWPVIHVHGSSHTGAALESTPDCREGWLPQFVRRGIPTYVVDQAGRRRSGFDESRIHQAVANSELDSIPTFGRITSNGAWTAWFGHILPDSSTGSQGNILNGTMIRHGDPGDPPGDDALHTNDYGPRFPIGTIDPGIAAREGALGPAPNPVNNHYLACCTTSSWFPTERSRFRDRFARPASRKASHPRTRGLPARWPTWSHDDAGHQFSAGREPDSAVGRREHPRQALSCRVAPGVMTPISVGGRHPRPARETPPRSRARRPRGCRPG